MTPAERPTDMDRAKAATWQKMIDQGHLAFAMLSPVQQDQVRARIAWATTEDGPDE